MAAFDRNPKVVYRALGSGGGGVLLHLETGAYHELNSTGSLIWGLVDGARDPQGVADELRCTCEDVPESLDEIVETFLQGLLERELVTRSAP